MRAVGRGNRDQLCLPLIFGAKLDLKFADDVSAFFVEGDQDRAGECAADLNGHEVGIDEGEILVSDDGLVLDAGDEGLVLLLRDPDLGLHDGIVVIDLVDDSGIRQVAGDAGGVAAGGAERLAVESLAGGLYLFDAAVRGDRDLFGAALSGEFISVGRAVVENIVIIADLCDTAVVVAKGICRMLSPVQADVSVRDDRSAVNEAFVRLVADRVAKLMALVAGVDKIVFAVDLADGRCLKEAVAFEPGAGSVMPSGNQGLGLALCCEHVLFQLHDHGVFTELYFADHLHLCTDRLRKFCHLFFADLRQFHFFFTGRTKTIVEPDATVIICQDSRIKDHIFRYDLTAENIFRIMNMSIELERTCGGIADGNADLRIEGEAIVKIISAIRALCDVRRPQLHGIAGVGGVLCAQIAHIFVMPVL